MQQKIKLMHYLLIGISVFLIQILFSSCKKKVDNEITCQYIYTNTSDFSIVMKVFNNTTALINQYTISANDSIIIELTGEGGAGPFEYNTYENQIGDSVSIIFAQNRYIAYKKGSGVLFEKSYIKTKTSNNMVVLNYSFTNEDYNAATPIK